MHKEENILMNLHFDGPFPVYSCHSQDLGIVVILQYLLVTITANVTSICLLQNQINLSLQFSLSNKSNQFSNKINFQLQFSPLTILYS